MRAVLPWLGVALLACNPDPGEVNQQVGLRDLSDDGATNAERGSVDISEVLWSGSVNNEGVWDPTDIFIEFRNEGARPLNMSGWHILIQGTHYQTYRMPETDIILGVGEHRFVTAKTSGCFPEPDWVIDGLEIPYGDPFRITLRDVDERLMEPIGSKEMDPFAGGYDLAVSRSMERINLMFGGYGTEPHQWHHYTTAAVDVVNNDKIAEGCRERTLASPGRPNSPDYSGAFASGGFE